MREIITIIRKLVKSASAADGTRGPPYNKDKVLKVGVKLIHLLPLAEILNSSIGSTILSEFCDFPPSPSHLGFKLYLKQKITRTGKRHLL